MITKCMKFCLVLATVFGVHPIHALDCVENRKNIPDKPSGNDLSSSKSLTVITPSSDIRSPSVAHIIWPYKPALLYEVVREYDEFPDFVPAVEKSRVLAREANRVWVYQRLKLPLPFKDRHYVIESRSRESIAAPGHYSVDWTLSTRFGPSDPPDTAVVPEAFSGCWDILPSSAGGVDAIYAITLKPGGYIPDWAARAAVKHYLEDLMAAVRQRLEKVR